MLMVSDPEKFLVVHQGALGDFVTCFPGILLLRKNGYSVDVVQRPELGQLACFLNLADSFFSIESSWFASLYSDLPSVQAKNILALYQGIILFSFSIDLKKRIQKIFKKPVILISPQPDVDTRIHVSDHILSCLQKNDSINLEIPVQDREIYIDRRNSNRKPEKIFIHPGSGSVRKNWPISFFSDIFKKLRISDKNPVFLTGPAETGLVKSLEALGHKKSDILQVFELSPLVSILEKGKGYIGNDSGVSHIAAFLGLPCVIIFGPSDPVRWMPRGRASIALRADTDCMPCFERKNTVCPGFECINLVLPEEVEKAFHSLLQKT